MAGLSARMMAEAAARDGFRALAPDVFGDLGTRRAASGGQAIASAAALRIEPARFFPTALDALRRRPGLPGPARGAAGVRGHEIVFARRALALDEAGAAALARRPATHDLPPAGSRFLPGGPVCSVSARGRDAAEVRARLAQGRDSVLDFLETCHDRGCASPFLPR